MKYILIPEDVAKDHIPNGAKILYGYILSLHRTRKGIGCYATNNIFAEYMRTNPRQIQRYLLILKQRKRIAIIIRRDNHGLIISRKLVPISLNDRKCRIKE